MTTVASTPSADTAQRKQVQGGLGDQIRVTSALALAGALFWTVGWAAVQPMDPRGPLTLLASTRPMTTLVYMAVLSVAAAGLSVLVAGRPHVNLGGIAVGVGLAALNLHGAEADKLGGYVRADTGPTWPMLSLMLELWLWTAIVGLGHAAGRWCHGWMYDGGEPARGGKVGDGALMSVLPAILLAALTGYLVLPYLMGPARDEVLKFQIYFALGGSLLIGSMIGQFLFRPGVSWWPLVAVGIVGTAAYLVGSPTLPADGSEYLTLRYLPGVIARPLPIEFAAMGAVGGIFGLSGPRWLASLESQAVAE